MNCEESIPNGYKWIDKEGLFQITKKSQEKLVSNAYPVVTHRIEIVNLQSNKRKMVIKIHYCYSDDNSIQQDYRYDEDEIRTGSFMKHIPIDVYIAPDYNRKICAIYKAIIQLQIRKIPIERKEKCEFGWNGKKFFWQEQLKEIPSEYSTALNLANILSNNNYTVNALVLAAIHGPLKALLLQIGISHDYVTYICGSTGVGKTQLSKIFCDYIVNKDLTISLGSDRKEIQLFLQNIRDITIVLDDFCKTTSSRVKERQIHIISEVIQNASNAGKVLIDDKSLDSKSNSIHLVVTAESKINNISTLNRCFFVEMSEEVPSALWKSIRNFSELHMMKAFMYYFLEYVHRDYSGFSNKFKSNYEYYQEKLQKNLFIWDSSKNRMINTLALQVTLAKSIDDYFGSVGIDVKLKQKIFEGFSSCILICGENLSNYINELKHNENRQRYLPVLADIILSIGNGMYLAKTEKAYFKNVNNPSKLEQCIGTCIHSGYISFSANIMCKLIAQKLELEQVSPSVLGKELNYYALAHVDSERKTSCRWGSQKRLFHVKVQELVELIYPDYEHSYYINDNFY